MHLKGICGGQNNGEDRGKVEKGQKYDIQNNKGDLVTRIQDLHITSLQPYG